MEEKVRENRRDSTAFDIHLRTVAPALRRNDKQLDTLPWIQSCFRCLDNRRRRRTEARIGVGNQTFEVVEK